MNDALGFICMRIVQLELKEKTIYTCTELRRGWGMWYGYAETFDCVTAGRKEVTLIKRKQKRQYSRVNEVTHHTDVLSFYDNHDVIYGEM